MIRISQLGDRRAVDGRLALRFIRHSPGFTAVAVLTLALGIGITTTVASIADHVLVRGLPFRDSGRLMMMLEGDSHGGLRTPSPPTVEDWRRDPGVAQAFDDVSFVRGDGVAVRVGEVTESVGCAFAGPEFFPLVGVRPSLGRLLVADDHRPDAPSVAVISNRLWLRRFGGDPNVVGRTMGVDSVPTTVVGVLPPGAVYPPFADVWMSVNKYGHPEILTRRGLHVDSRTVGRLRAGVDSARAATLMRAVGTRLGMAYPAEQQGWMPAMMPVRLEIIGNVRPMLLTLAGAGLAVLLLACANVAGLLLARISSRSRELAVRRAIGASASRVTAQLFTETLALAALGGALGVGLTVAGVALTRKFGRGRLPRIDELAVDWRVLGIAMAATIVTALLCGLWPAIRAARDDSMTVLRASAHGAVGVRADARLRRLLVTVQFALALVLLVGAGLLLRSFQRASAVNIGFDPSGLVTLAVHPPAGAYDKPAEAAALYTRLMAAARAVPGVTDAAFINHVPFSGASIYTTISIPGRAALDSSNQVFYRTVSDSYLRTMRMTMKRGRWFDDADIRSPSGTFVINEAMARLYWPSQDPVGQHLTVTRSSQARPDFGQPISGTVVGVVADVHQRGPDVPPDVEVYVPFTLETWPWGSLIVRARDGARSTAALARAVAGVDSRLVGKGAAAERDFGLMESNVASSLEPRRFSMSLVGGFAACALLLAAIGMYGVVAYSVGQRTREIGVRKALGATDGDVATLLMRESFRMVVVGVIVGAAGAWGGARLIRSLLFDTGAGDPLTYMVTVAVLAAVAVLATYLPARSAMRLPPTTAMRAE